MNKNYDPYRRQRVSPGLRTVLGIGGAAASMAAVLVGCAPKGGEQVPVSVPSSVSSSTHEVSPSQAPATVASSPANTASYRTYTETTDNRNGTPLFGSPDGATVPNGAPGGIPYDVNVAVRCWAPNTSGMGSVNAFYDVVEPNPYVNVWAPADTFANGDPEGISGGTHTIDAAVPECPITLIDQANAQSAQ